MQRSMWSGFVATLPVALSVGAYGSVLGMLAAQKNISWIELLLMNLSIFAGSAQFVMVDMWIAPLPIIEITVAVLVINLRYLLIGASLKPVFQGKPLCQKFMIMHLVADENWAVTMAAHRQGKASTGFLLGGGLCLFFVWSFGTMMGHSLGAVIRNPETYALDFAFIAVFTALVIGLWRGKNDIVPWLVAAALAIIAEKLLPGKWYILIGGISGALVSALTKDLSEGAGS
ncbi:MAG TPA: branched-chain amino acid ABC transporter permease [Desulfobacterales bacterium]|nr:branched-chain amino acid ABC transporter permease [Desulfobacterales bacterium]